MRVQAPRQTTMRTVAMAGALRALERDAGHLASTSSSSSSSSSRRREVPCVLMDRSDRALPYEVVWEEQKRLVESKCRELDRADRCARQDVLLVQHEPVCLSGGEHHGKPTIRRGRPAAAAVPDGARRRGHLSRPGAARALPRESPRPSRPDPTTD